MALRRRISSGASFPGCQEASSSSKLTAMCSSRICSAAVGTVSATEPVSARWETFRVSLYLYEVIPSPTYQRQTSSPRLRLRKSEGGEGVRPFSSTALRHVRAMSEVRGPTYPRIPSTSLPAQLICSLARRASAMRGRRRKKLRVLSGAKGCSQRISEISSVHMPSWGVYSRLDTPSSPVQPNRSAALLRR